VAISRKYPKPLSLNVASWSAAARFLLGLRRLRAGQYRHEQVHVDAEQPFGCLPSHRVGDGGAHVAPLGDITGVAEAVHQLRPGLRDAADVPAELRRLAGEAVARQGRQHEVERVLRLPAVSGRVGQRADGLQEFDDRAGPAVRHDQRQRVLMRRLHMDEVDIHPVDLGRELRQRVELRLDLAPVVVGRPVAGERLHRRQLHALGAVCNELFRRPARRLDPASQLSELLVGNLDLERTYASAGLGGGSHGQPPF
jgi:hypothetical protein